MIKLTHVKLFFLISFAILLEVVALPMALGQYFEIDVLMIVLVFYVYYVRRADVLWVAMIIGFSKDLFTNGLFGVEVFGYGIAAIFLIWTSRKFDREVFFVILGVTAAAAVLKLMVGLIFHLGELKQIAAIITAMGKGLIGVMWTTIFSWPTIKLIQRLTLERSQQLEFRF